MVCIISLTLLLATGICKFYTRQRHPHVYCYTNRISPCVDTHPENITLREFMFMMDAWWLTDWHIACDDALERILKLQGLSNAHTCNSLQVLNERRTSNREGREWWRQSKCVTVSSCHLIDLHMDISHSCRDDFFLCHTRFPIYSTGNTPWMPLCL